MGTKFLVEIITTLLDFLIFFIDKIWYMTLLTKSLMLYNQYLVSILIIIDNYKCKYPIFFEVRLVLVYSSLGLKSNSCQVGLGFRSFFPFILISFSLILVVVLGLSLNFIFSFLFTFYFYFYCFKPFGPTLKLTHHTSRPNWPLTHFFRNLSLSKALLPWPNYSCNPLNNSPLRPTTYSPNTFGLLKPKP